MTIAVIGAGISGLACAHKLIESGAQDVHILESADEAGGLCRTVSAEGFRFDLGPHQLHTSDAAIVCLLQDLLGGDLIELPRHAAISMHGKLLNYPLGISDLLTGLPLTTAIASGIDFAKAKLQKSPPPATFKDWVLSNYGDRLYQQYFEPYTRKVWGCDPSQLSADCAEERLASQSLWDVIMSAFNSRRHRHSYLTHSPYNASFYYPRRGIGQLADQWRQRLKSSGATFHMNSEVKAIHRNGRAFRLSGDGIRTSDFDKVISTIPLNLLGAALQNGGFTDVPIGKAHYRSMVFTMLALKEQPAAKYHWIYFPSPETSFLRITQFQAISPDMSPPHAASICTETTCEYGDNCWTSRDELIAQRSISDLCAAGLISEKDVTSFNVQRARYAYPFMHMNYRQDLKDMMDYIDNIPGIFTTGRQGAFKYLDVCDLIPVAYQAAVKALTSRIS